MNNSLNITHFNEWKDQIQMLIKKTYDVLKDYMIKHDLITRKTKRGDRSCNVSIFCGQFILLIVMM